jgi:hypothetical protein
MNDEWEPIVFFTTIVHLLHGFRANAQDQKLDVVSNWEKWGQPQLLENTQVTSALTHLFGSMYRMTGEEAIH